MEGAGGQIKRRQTIDREAAYLVFALEEGPQFGFAFAGGPLAGLPARVAQAAFRQRPLHGLPVVLELHVARRLEARLVGLHHLLGVLETNTRVMFLFERICRNTLF